MAPGRANATQCVAVEGAESGWGVVGSDGWLTGRWVVVVVARLRHAVLVNRIRSSAGDILCITNTKHRSLACCANQINFICALRCARTRGRSISDKNMCGARVCVCVCRDA